MLLIMKGVGPDYKVLDSSTLKSIMSTPSGMVSENIRIKFFRIWLETLSRYETRIKTLKRKCTVQIGPYKPVKA